MPGFTLDLNVLLFPAFISSAFAAFIFFVLIVNRLRRILRSSKGRPAKHSSISGNVFKFLLTLLWFALSAAVFFLAAFTQSYRNFTKREHVAIVRCVEVNEANKMMKLEYTPVDDGRLGEKQDFLLQGDQWTIEGNILRWEDWLNFAGIHTMYKLERVRGRYIETEDERSHMPSAFDLEKDPQRFHWQWLYKYGHQLRFVESVYGNTVYTYPSDHYVYDIYVTTSGLSVEIRDL